MARPLLTMNKAQVITEYSITFALVLAIVASMTVFVKRVLQARIRDTRNKVTEILQAQYNGPGKVPYEYEPYYTETATQAITSYNENQNLIGGPLGTSGQFVKDFNLIVTPQTNSVQLPPKDAD